MGYKISTTIDQTKCTGCGRCAAVCPYNSIEIIRAFATVTGKNSMHCGQCVAVCPHNAVTVDNIVVPTPVTEDMPPEAEQFFNLISNRRSCRTYLRQEVDVDTLEDLVKFGLWAPSGTNSQKWTFTIIPDRQSVESFAVAVGNFYRKINKQAANPFLRFFAKLFMNDVLGLYYKRYYKKITNALKAWDEEKKDQLFHEAPATIIVAMKPGASCPHDDALLATQNIILGAHALGLGSCLIGFASKAMARDKSIAAHIGIPANETVYAVIALGHPKYGYVRPSGRLPLRPRYFKKIGG